MPLSSPFPGQDFLHHATSYSPRRGAFVLGTAHSAGERGTTLVDQASLFVAAGICAAALALTMLSVWIHNRAERFLVGWTIGLLLLGGGVILYSVMPPDRMDVVATAFTMELIGFYAVLVAARLFTRRPTTGLHVALFAALAVPVTIPIVLGYDGFGIIVYNFVVGALLVATAAHYWSARAEAPTCIALMTILYNLAALSFFACGTILLHEKRWVLHMRPDNWAEQFNAIMCIAGITGIGALSFGLNHARAARKHREDAETDMLTGLLNRRALFERLGRGAFAPGHAVIAFDLDRFKSINDRYGHAAGDEVLRRFADALRLNTREGDLAARTGGEEFVLVLRGASLPIATSTAERIRALFAESHVETDRGRVAATASAGVALAGDGDEGFEHVLNRADDALYRAKNGGRNRVTAELHVGSFRAVG